MLNHQYNNIIYSPTVEIYTLSSSNTTSNSIDTKEATHINFRKQIQHQLCYSKHYRSLNFLSPPNYHGIKNNFNESEQKYNQSLLSQNSNNTIIHIPSPPYPSTICITQNNNRNKQTVEDYQNFTILNLNHNSQSLPIPYSKNIIPKNNERIYMYPKHKDKIHFLKH